MGLTKEARDCFMTTLKKDPKHDKAYFFLGHTYMADKNYKEAIQAYLNSINANTSEEDKYVTYYNIGTCYEFMGYSYPEAIKYFDLAISKKIDCINSRYRKARCYQKILFDIIRYKDLYGSQKKSWAAKESKEKTLKPALDNTIEAFNQVLKIAENDKDFIIMSYYHLCLTYLLVEDEKSTHNVFEKLKESQFTAYSLSEALKESQFREQKKKMVSYLESVLPTGYSFEIPYATQINIFDYVKGNN
jgi:tetratricopeptide (TPR) repeat protein